MLRFSFEHRGLKFSCLDAGGSGQALIALHAHWMEGQTFASLATALAPEWRVIAPDQRGHGDFDHAPTYARSDYLDDPGARLNIKIRYKILGLAISRPQTFDFFAISGTDGVVHWQYQD